MRFVRDAAQPVPTTRAGRAGTIVHDEAIAELGLGECAGACALTFERDLERLAYRREQPGALAGVE